MFEAVYDTYTPLKRYAASSELLQVLWDRHQEQIIRKPKTIALLVGPCQQLQAVVSSVL